MEEKRGPFALWLPPFSVRALLAFALLGASVYALLAVGVEVAAPLLALLGVVVEKYFGKDA